MEDQNKFGPIIKLIELSQSIIVVLPPDPSQDQIVSGLSIYSALKDSGKDSQIGCGSPISLDPKQYGVSEIADTIGSKNLLISFDYDENNLDKVDYDVRDDGKFYLMVKPKNGAPVPDASNVKFSYSGAEADLVIVFGIGSLEELGKIYADEKNFLDNVKIISINNTPRSISFTPNVIHEQNISYSEITSKLLEKSNLKLSSQTAMNLLNSIHEETSGLTSPKMTADTFSSIAFLMRSGARLPNQQIFVPRYSQPPFFEVPHAPAPALAEEPPIPEEDDTKQVPLDWKQPKIFRASDL